MENLRPFQIVLLLVFGVVALISVIVLASFKGFNVGAVNPYGGQVVIWGTFESRPFDQVLQDMGRIDKNLRVVTYVQKDPRTFEADLVNAIADGTGPDAILLSSESLVTLRSKLSPIPYSNFSRRLLQDNYVDGFELFALNDGLYAVPLLVDPLIMYWNRDILAAGGLAVAPTTWEALTSTVEQITLRDATRNISQATVAFGTYQNVLNAKPVLLSLLLQSGSKLVEEGRERYAVALDTARDNTSRRPLTSTLQFYVEFSNPASPLYSWNRTFQDDLTAFVGERLAIYFGFGSEAGRIRGQNPNFNFDAAALPQGAGSTVKRVYGKFYGLAIVRSGSNQSGAYRAALALSSSEPTAKLAESLALAPAHRSILSGGSSDPIRQVIFNHALIARGWLDPSAVGSDEVFRQMIEDVLSGRSQVTTASSDTIRRLQLQF